MDKKYYIEVMCAWCKSIILLRKCYFKRNKKGLFYCNHSHQILYRNKYNNPSKREEIKKKIGKSSKERGAIYIALNHENFKNKKWVKKGKEHPNWKESISYKGLHQWLNKNYGKAYKCERIECDHTSKFFDWCRIKNKKYEKNRDNFMMMCRSCHNIYDKRINNIIKNKNA